jgi:hypothetical protein
MSVSDPGSVNLGRARDGLPAGGFVYANSFDDIAHQLSLCRDHGLGPSIAVYEPGFLRAVLAYHHAGQLPSGAFVKLYMCSDRGLTGTAFGLPPTAASLAAYLELLEGTGLTWAASAVGDDLGRTDVCRLALEAGGHLHVGLEFYGGDRTPTNAELVREAADACAAFGRPVASCEQARRPQLPAARRSRRAPPEQRSRANELPDFYERYIAGSIRDAAAFAGFFHLPVTIFSLPSDDGRHDGRPPAVVTDVAKLWPTLPATWTRSTIDEIRVVADATAFTPRDEFTERRDRRPALQVTVTRWAGDEPYEQVHVLYLLTREKGRLGIKTMVPLAVAEGPPVSRRE